MNRLSCLILAILCLLAAAAVVRGDQHKWRSIGWNVYWPETVRVSVPADWDTKKVQAAVSALEAKLRHRSEINLTRPGKPLQVGDQLRVVEAGVRVVLVPPGSRPKPHVTIRVAAQSVDDRGCVDFVPGIKADIEVSPKDVWRSEDIYEVVYHEATHMSGLDH